MYCVTQVRAWANLLTQRRLRRTRVSLSTEGNSSVEDTTFPKTRVRSAVGLGAYAVKLSCEVKMRAMTKDRSYRLEFPAVRSSTRSLPQANS